MRSVLLWNGLINMISVYSFAMLSAIGFYLQKTTRIYIYFFCWRVHKRELFTNCDSVAAHAPGVGCGNNFLCLRKVSPDFNNLPKDL